MVYVYCQNIMLIDILLIAKTTRVACVEYTMVLE